MSDPTDCIAERLYDGSGRIWIRFKPGTDLEQKLAALSALGLGGERWSGWVPPTRREKSVPKAKRGAKRRGYQ